MQEARGMMAFILVVVLVVFTPALCSATHTGAPDMEHGESVTSEAPSVSGAQVGGGEITFSVKGGKVTFSHDAHVAGAALTCTDCHAALYITKGKHKKATMAQMQKGQSCGACHNGKKAFSVKADCGRCHAK